jgi:MYXO-CTERM domain-containing protein
VVYGTEWSIMKLVMTRILKMNMKRTSICTGVIGGIAVAGSAMAGMNGLSYDFVEQTGDGAVAGTYTVRVYAELDGGNRLDAVYGRSEYQLYMNYHDGATAYQSSLGGPTSQSINPAFFPLAPSLEWDSYVTIGSLYSTDNALQSIGIDWSGWDPAGGDMFADNGTWFVTPADVQGEAVDGKVLVAQFTTFAGAGSYDMTFSAGFQGKDGAGETWQSGHSISITGADIPAPGAIALLGLAGLAGRRRRRA